MVRRVVLHVNRKSRRARERLPLALAAFRDLGVEVVQVDDLAAPPPADAIVVGGGDGTVHRALDRLVELGRPVGILPFGTANDLARTLGIPEDVAGACAVIAAGAVRRIDLGVVNGRRFVNAASLGLGVAVTRALSRTVKGRLGRLAYAWAALRVALRARAFSATIRHPGGEEAVRTLQVAVGNGRHYGGGMTIAEDAAIDDGLLDLYSLEVESRFRLLLLLPALRAGTHGRWAAVRALRADRFEVETRRQRRVTADGEFATVTPAVFRVEPKALPVIVPAPSPQDPADPAGRT